MGASAIDFRGSTPCTLTSSRSFSITRTHLTGSGNLKNGFKPPLRVDVHETVSPSRERILVLRNPASWDFELLRPETYQALATAMKLCHLDAINVFFVKQGGEFT